FYCSRSGRTLTVAISMAVLRDRAADALARARARLSAHRFWIQSAGVALLALAVLGTIGSLALRRARAWEAQVAALVQLDRTARDVLDRFQPSDSVEAAHWRESEETLLQLARENVNPLAVASLVAQRAEE